MKLITFNNGQEPRLGVQVEDRVIDLSTASGGKLPNDMRQFLESGQAGLDTAQTVADEALGREQTISLEAVNIMAPVLNPSKIIAIGLNYKDHCQEQNIEPPQTPLIFAKLPSALVGPGEAVRWNPALTHQVDFEAELAVIIGTQARQVTEAEAWNYVAGYTICNDVSARDLQFGDGQWTRAKSLDTFCPLGPYLVTKDEIPDPHNLSIRCTVNDQLMQDSNTAEMTFRIPFIIEYVSQAFTLFPGDIITTGTPAGVGVFRSPQQFLKNGDMVTIEVEGLGRLINPCREMGEL